MIEPGDVIGGRYRMERAIGAGGMGLVYRAFDEKRNERAAVKVLNEQVLDAPHVISRFRREAKVLLRVEHPGVIDVREVGELPSGVPYYVMELLEGRDLRQEQRARGFLPPEEAAAYVERAARALQVVHDAGIVHRDLKPQNIFVVNLTGPREVKLIDFGISKLTEESEATLTATAAVLGTPHYMSPEQIFASKDVDSRADIWSMGVILYLLVTGRLPFARPSVPAVIAAIPTEPPEGYSPAELDRIPELLRGIVARCLEKDPSLRFQSATELAEALGPFLPEGGEIIAPEIGVPSTVPPVMLARTGGYRAKRSSHPPPGSATKPALPLDRLRPGAPRIEERDAGLDDVTAPSSRRLKTLGPERAERPLGRIAVALAVALLLGLMAIVLLVDRIAPRSPLPPNIEGNSPSAPSAAPSVALPPEAPKIEPTPVVSAPSNDASKRPRPKAPQKPAGTKPSAPVESKPKQGKDGAPLHL